MSERLLRLLARAVGPAHVLTDPDVRAGYEVDWTRRFSGSCIAVVRPKDAQQIATVIAACSNAGVGVIPQGGNTGLVGGAVPGGQMRAIVLSTTRLDAVRDLDVVSGQVTAQAGVTLAALETSLTGTGWEFGVDLAARATATLGGMIATNAGGTRVLRYGSMRANVLGVEAVLGNGSIVQHLGGLVKDNTGFDLAGLLCGSEGTLGVVTAARLRLVPAWPDRLAAAIRCEDWGDAVGLASHLRRTVEGLDGLEAIDRRCAENAERSLDVRSPVPNAPVTLFAVWAGRGEPPPGLVDVVAERQHVVGSPSALLQVRERQAEAIGRIGIPHKFDVTLPLDRLAEFTTRIRWALPASVPLFLFGHLGDGNLHVNVVGPPADDSTIDRIVLEEVSRCEGSISAEHGIGRAKVPYLGLSRSAAEIGAMRAIKTALDPFGVMNPGVLLA